MIYVNDHIDRLDVAAALQVVSPQRRQQALRYRHEHDQRLCLAAYLLLEQALRQEYGIDRLPPFDYGPQGKPFFASLPHIHFNLSHCREAAVCVVSDHPVGIDVESLSHYDTALLPPTMSLSEQQHIACAESPAVAFIRLWTMKESLLKLTGQGISEHLPSLLLDTQPYIFHTTIHHDYIITTCQHRPCL